VRRRSTRRVLDTNGLRWKAGWVTSN